MTDGFNVDDLNRLARPLYDSAEGIENLAGNAPNIPDAGESTGIVASALVVFGGVVAKIATAAANSADAAQAAQLKYDAADDHAANTVSPADAHTRGVR
jgi:hypothetical protein